MSRLLQLTPGSVFAGEYRVVGPLAEGGMGAVYEVEQVGTGAARALKIMHPTMVGDEKLRARFVQEARVSALIESDHVVQVVAAGVDARSGTPWLAMELLRGETLASFVAHKGPLDGDEMREIFSQLCHALAAAHDRGIVHRDLKPENIFLAVPRREGVPFTVKVLDFGIAKLVAEAHTHTAAIGTPLWMAPEQTESNVPVAPATDVWALGLLAFWGVTGMHYWRIANAERLSAHALLREVVLDPLDSASARAQSYGVAHHIPPGFDDWFSRCVVREMDRRFQNARQAREALERLFPPSSVPSTGRRHPQLVVTPSYPEREMLQRLAHTPDQSASDIASEPTAPSDPMAMHRAQAGSGRGIVSPAAHSSRATPDRGGEPDGVGATDEPVEVTDEHHALPVGRGMPIAAVAVAILALLALSGIGLALRDRAKPVAPVASSKPNSNQTGAGMALSAPPPLKACPPRMSQMPGGTFFMGSKGDHVMVQPFCIDVTEVTVSDYADCAKKGLCGDTKDMAEGMCNWPRRATKPKHPMNCVDWEQAAAYCHTIAKRLPTMEEWEWAARSGDEGYTFPWGDEAPNEQLCWSGGLKRSALGTCEVGAHPSGASKYFVQDLAGNVAEWVDGDAKTHDSVRPVVGDHFLSESASFAKDVSGRTSVATRLVARKHRANTIGFRCALTP